MSMISGVPLPAPDRDSGPFWEAAATGELRIQACADCGRLRMPPRPMCPWCTSLEQEWRLMSGRGTVWSYTVAHPPLLPAFAEQAPYNVVVVALDEDPTIRLVGNVVESPGTSLGTVDPTTIEIGEPVQVVFDEVGEGVFLPRWIRAEPQA
jgi:uncharacterized protein